MFRVFVARWRRIGRQAKTPIEKIVHLSLYCINIHTIGFLVHKHLPINLEQADDMRFNSIAKSFLVLCVNNTCARHEDVRGDGTESAIFFFFWFNAEACDDDIVVVVVVAVCRSALCFCSRYFSPGEIENGNGINKLIEFMTIAPTNSKLNRTLKASATKKYILIFSLFFVELHLNCAKQFRKTKKKYIPQSATLSANGYIFRAKFVCILLMSFFEKLWPSSG